MLLSLCLLLACATDPQGAGGDGAAHDDTGPTSDGGGDGGADGGGDSGTDGGAAPDVTWAEVQPILVDNCYGCHASNGIAMQLEGYESASVWSHEIESATDEERMPPWPPTDSCLSLKDVRGLDDAEKATLARWAELGAPRGNAEDVELPGPDESDADVWVQLEEAYTPESGLEDDYRCFVVDPQLAQDVSITRFQVFPGNTAIVHHVLLYDDRNGDSVALDAADPGPGYTCFGSSGVSDSQTLGGWVPGMDRGVEFPEGTGVELAAGSLLVLQIHYAPQNDPGRPDQTRMALELADGAVEDLYLIPFYDTDLDIPPGQAAHVEGVRYTNEYIPFKVWGVTPHMHKLGAAISAGITREGEDQCLVDIPDWDFEYQQFYWFEEPFQVEMGDEMWLQCVYDNTTANPDNPHSPPETVHWGEGTGDEMCLVYVMATL